MAFRQKRDSWDEFLREHRTDLRECGIPDEVFEKRLRFLVFLDHGFDQWGYAKNPHAFFHPDVLTDEQLDRLADLVEEHFDLSYAEVIRSRWTRLPG